MKDRRSLLLIPFFVACVNAVPGVGNLFGFVAIVAALLLGTAFLLFRGDSYGSTMLGIVMALFGVLGTLISCFAWIPMVR